MGRSPACQEGLLQVEGSKIPCEESVAGFSPGGKEGTCPATPCLPENVLFLGHQGRSRRQTPLDAMRAKRGP